MRRVLATLLGLAAACTDRPVGEDTDAASTSAATTSTTTTEAPTTGTAGDAGSTTEAIEPCLEVRYHDHEPSAWMLTCGLPELCAGDEPLVFTTTTGEPHEPGDVGVDDLERARCMAAALRDRSHGQIAWWMTAGPDVIWSPRSLEITGHTVLVHSVLAAVNLSLPPSNNVYEGVYSLRPPEFFAACAEGDALAVWLCLVDAFEPMCLPGPLSCPK